MTRIHPTRQRTSHDAAWNTLIEFAALFRTEAPWTDLEFLPPIAIEHPDDGETAYCTLMRTPGESCIVMVYLGIDGLKLWLDDITGRIRPESPTERAALDEFPDEEEEIQLLYQRFHGYLITFNGPGSPSVHRKVRLPHARTANSQERVFTSFEVIAYPRGEDSREPAPEELDRLGEILLGLRSVAEALRLDGEEFIASRGENELWHISPALDPERREMSWKGAWRSSPVSIAELEEQRLDIEESILDGVDEISLLKSLAVEENEESTWKALAPNLTRRNDGILLVTTRDPVRLSHRDAPPFHRRALGLISVPACSFIGAVALEDPEEKPVEVRRALLELLLALGSIPALMVVTEKCEEEILQPMADAFGFRIHCDPMPENLRAGICEAIADHFAEIADGKVNEDGLHAVMKQTGELSEAGPASDRLKQVIEQLDGFCSDHLTPTLYQEAIDLATTIDLALSPSPLRRGRAEGWACAIACHVNRGESRITTEEICEWFGVAETTARRRLKMIEEIATEVAHAH